MDIINIQQDVYYVHQLSIVNPARIAINVLVASLDFIFIIINVIPHVLAQLHSKILLTKLVINVPIIVRHVQEILLDQFVQIVLMDIY